MLSGTMVTTDQDIVDTHDGLTSLREALEFAHSNPGYDTITFGDGSLLSGGTNFTDNVADTITLRGTELTINSNVTIEGTGSALLSVSGNYMSRVFLVNSNTIAEIRNLTITQGHTSLGGGIRNLGTLTLNQSTLHGNFAYQFGGGISNENSLMIIQSTLYENSANYHGGGIENYTGSVTVINSTIVGNRANVSGIVGTGGGIWTRNNDFTFTTLFNTIVAGNFVGTGSTANDIAEKNLDSASRNNLIGDAGSDGGLSNSVSWHIVGAAVTDIFTTGLLASNGGPTQTIALKRGSLAENAGSNSNASTNGLVSGTALNTDQRGTGFARFNGTVDIGAFEIQNTSPTDITLDDNNLNENAGANAVVGNLSATDPDTAETFTFTLAAGVGDNDLFNINGTELWANDSFNFEGQSTYTVNVTVEDSVGNTFNKQLTINVVNVNETPTDITLDDNNLNQDAGVNAVVGNLSATDPDTDETFTFSLAAGVDENDQFSINGAELIAIDPSSLNLGNHLVSVTVTDSAQNTYSKQLTVVISEAGSLIVTTNSDSSTDTDGLTSLREALAYADANSGADTITFGDGSSIIGGTNFTDNIADTITLNGSQLTLNSDIIISGPGSALLSISGNNASRVFWITSQITTEIRDLTITKGNASGGEGGGIFSYSTVTIVGCVLTENTAEYFGGGISIIVGTLTVIQSTISKNSSNYHGGGISNFLGTLTIMQSTLSENSSTAHGGGIYNYGTLSVVQSTLAGNSANFHGGGIHNEYGLVTVTNSTLVGNRAEANGDHAGTGGGIFTDNDEYAFTTIYNTILAGNFVGRGTIANDIGEKNIEAASRNNLIGDAGSAGGLSNGVNGHIVGADVADIFTTGTLADNGGPTQTIALKRGSPAENAGSNANATENGLDGGTALSSDQRGTGFARFNATVDIGAFEIQNTSPTDITLDDNNLIENAGVDVVVGDLSATDPDIGETFTFTLAAGVGDNDLFNINGTELRANDSFNFEGQSTYTVTVTVEDSVGNTFNKQLTINVVNVNETPTNITLDDNNLNENAGANAVVGNLSGTDPDTGETFTFTLPIGANDNNQFNISGNALRAKSSLNFEAINSYNVTVRVTDTVGNTFNKQFTINVVNVNELPTFNLANTTTTINENSSTASRIKLADLVVQDDALGTNLFTLSGVDNNSFEIIGTELFLKAGTVLNYEPKQSYSFSINLDDSTIGTDTDDTESYSLTIFDVNEQPTNITLNNNTVAENQAVGTSVGLLTGTDPDATQTFTFTLVDDFGDNASFLLDGNTLKTAASFNKEVKDTYTIKVHMEDQNGLGIEREFTITINDVNEQPTNITLNNSTAQQFQVVGTTIGQLSATDPDTGETFTYSLVPDFGDNSRFSIDGNMLKTNAIFDTSSQPNYTIKVRVTDEDGLTYEAEFTVDVAPTYPPGFIGVVADPANPGQQMLLILGTAENDVIIVNAVRTRTRGGFTTVYQVNLNGVRSSSYSPTSRIVVQSLAGNDIIRFNGVFVHTATIDGGDHNDMIQASNLADIIHGGSGDDIIYGYGGADTIYGGQGNDRIFGSVGRNIMFGEQGNDQINGQGILVGGAGDDGLNSIGSRNLMIGGVGMDTFTPGNTNIDPRRLGDIIINGTTDFDQNVSTLSTIQNEWQTGTGTSPTNLNPAAIHDDTDIDTLVDLTRLDYTFQATNDLQVRRNRRRI